MTQAIDTDIREIKTAIEANTKAIADLTLEMRVGFSDIKGEIKEVKGQINTSEAKLEGKIDKLDERTRLGFWGFVGRGLVLAVLIAWIPIVTRYLTSSLPDIFKP
jgi:hypothetical protein